MKKRFIFLLLFSCTGYLCALETQLKNLSTALSELQRKLFVHAPVTSDDAQKLTLTALKTNLKNILKDIIDPHRNFANEQERIAFFHFIIEQSLNAAKVMQVIAEKQYTAADLNEWYKNDTLSQKTSGALTQLDYKHYETRHDWRPLPPPPGQTKVSTNFDDARALKENLLDVAQNIIDLNVTFDRTQVKQSFKVIFDEALNAAMAEWPTEKKESFRQKITDVRS
ncbi:MAG: hypothetical protein AB7F19_05325 [Candidatus Babeliales bacterium]